MNYIENRLQLRELDFASQLLEARNAVDNRELRRKIAEKLLTEIKAIASDHASIHRLSLFDRNHFQLSNRYQERLNSSYVLLELARDLCLIGQDHVEDALFDLERPVMPGSAARSGMDTVKKVAESFDGLYDGLLALGNE